MNNIVQFPTHRIKHPEPQLEEQKEEPQQEMLAPQNEVRLPGGTSHVAMSFMAVLGIMRALEFYAGQGFDHGAKAREALGLLNPLSEGQQQQ